MHFFIITLACMAVSFFIGRLRFRKDLAMKPVRLLPEITFQIISGMIGILPIIHLLIGHSGPLQSMMMEWCVSNDEAVMAVIVIGAMIGILCIASGALMYGITVLGGRHKYWTIREG